MKKISTVLVFLLPFVLACSSSSTKDECTSDECLKQQAYDKVIAVHDEVMPMLSQVSELKKELESKLNAIQDSLVVEKLTNLMEELDRADQSMWVWMRAFNSDIEELPIDEALTYLKSEQEKIDRVAANIKTSIASAQAALEQPE